MELNGYIPSQGTCFAGPRMEDGRICAWWMVDIGQDHQVEALYSLLIFHTKKKKLIGLSKLSVNINNALISIICFQLSFKENMVCSITKEVSAAIVFLYVGFFWS